MFASVNLCAPCKDVKSFGTLIVFLQHSFFFSLFFAFYSLFSFHHFICLLSSVIFFLSSVFVPPHHSFILFRFFFFTPSIFPFFLSSHSFVSYFRQCFLSSLLLFLSLLSHVHLRRQLALEKTTSSLHYILKKIKTENCRTEQLRIRY